MALHRLQKVLARAGLGSRRSAEQYIVQGRVRVDGVIVDRLGVQVDARRQKIEVDGRRILAEPLLYIVLHKPRQMVSTMKDPEGRATVVDCLRGVESRVVPVGRLDYHTSGVLLLTNDGEFASRLTHPRTKTEKVYVAKIQGPVDDAGLERFRASVDVDGRSTQPAEVRLMRHEGDKSWLQITLREGKNRQIHRLGEAAGHAVLRLARVSFAGITHDGLRPGQWRYLTRDELVAFRKQIGAPTKVHAPPDARVHMGASTAASRAEPRRRSEKRKPRTGRTATGDQARGKKVVRKQRRRSASPQDDSSLRGGERPARTRRATENSRAQATSRRKKLKGRTGR